VVGREGCLVALEGDLGAGKTLFVKGFASGLGIAPDAVASPTFVIASEHARPTGMALVHLDLYRLERAEELEAVGFRDAISPGNAVAVEWADRFPASLPADRLVIRLERVAASAPEARRLRVTARGERSRVLLSNWRARIEQEEGSRCR